jgi:hypothetical protein
MEEEKISMEIVNPHAAGIDVGSRSHWVAVGQSEKDIREFGVFNQDLFERNQNQNQLLSEDYYKGSQKFR